MATFQPSVGLMLLMLWMLFECNVLHGQRAPRLLPGKTTRLPDMGGRTGISTRHIRPKLCSRMAYARWKGGGGFVDLRDAGLHPDPRPMQSRLLPVRGTRVVLLSTQYGLGRFPTEEVHQGDLHSFSRLEGRVWSASGCDVVVFPKVCARCAACCVRK